MWHTGTAVRSISFSISFCLWPPLLACCLPSTVPKTIEATSYKEEDILDGPGGGAAAIIKVKEDLPVMVNCDPGASEHGQLQPSPDIVRPPDQSPSDPLGRGGAPELQIL